MHCSSRGRPPPRALYLSRAASPARPAPRALLVLCAADPALPTPRTLLLPRAAGRSSCPSLPPRFRISVVGLFPDAFEERESLFLHRLSPRRQFCYRLFLLC
ncbi:hypothetical protein PR202_ga12838 [Eleusine coracana subsp. coracana]|uniref:Uncharacterized protein n=1 Tax=Eleusine coracana subsp. coracana TaxID=191504 RepID=A0AAV5CD53_ELECO|nr:hypothetical protein PR202_ga12838 [Eleusine coracana subsp. coracana]